MSRAVYVQLDEGDAQAAARSPSSSQFPDVVGRLVPEVARSDVPTKLTFDGRDEARVLEARDAFVATLPPGEPQRVD